MSKCLLAGQVLHAGNGREGWTTTQAERCPWRSLVGDGRRRRAHPEGGRERALLGRRDRLLMGEPQDALFAGLPIHCEEDRTLQAVLVGMLKKTTPRSQEKRNVVLPCSALAPLRGEGLSFSEAISTCFRKFADFGAGPHGLILVVPAPVLHRDLRTDRGVPVHISGLRLLQPSDVRRSGYERDWACVRTHPVCGRPCDADSVRAVGTRRLHDTGKPGWWWFITLVPFGSIILIVFWAMEGDKGSNQYGPPPGAQAVQPAPPGSFAAAPAAPVDGLGTLTSTSDPRSGMFPWSSGAPRRAEATLHRSDSTRSCP